VAVDKDLLFKPRLPEADVDIPDVGTVRVRALNRQEAKQLQKLPNDDQRDLHLIAMGLVEPSLSVSEVKQWAEASPAGEMEPVSDRILELSGMLDTSAKEAMKNFEDNPEDEFRVLPSAEVAQDSGADEGGTE
jgi:hypothetical protein